MYPKCIMRNLTPRSPIIAARRRIFARLSVCTGKQPMASVASFLALFLSTSIPLTKTSVRQGDLTFRGCRARMCLVDSR